MRRRRGECRATKQEVQTEELLKEDGRELEMIRVIETTRKKGIKEDRGKDRGRKGEERSSKRLISVNP